LTGTWRSGAGKRRNDRLALSGNRESRHGFSIDRNFTVTWRPFTVSKGNFMTKKIKKKQSQVAGGTGEHDGAWEDMDYNGKGGNGPMMLDSEEVVVPVPDIDDAVAQAASEKTTKLPRKKKQHREKGKGDTLNPAEDGDFERPRKRHKLRNSNNSRDDASPDYSHMRSRPAIATATATAEDSTRSSPVSSSSSSSPVSSSPEPEPEPELPTDPQSLLDHRTRIPASPPPSVTLQRFPLPSRPHKPEKSELASQGLDRALASAQLVDPLLSTPLSLDDEDGDDITGLGARTLKRLRDLGIVELFAGAL
jgi:hypothetical protein